MPPREWLNSYTEWTTAFYINLSGDYCSVACLQQRLATITDKDLETLQIADPGPRKVSYE